MTKKSQGTQRRVCGLSIKRDAGNWVWWCRPVIPVFGRLGQESREFEDNLGYIVRPCLNPPPPQKKKYATKGARQG
jgi:hypothetical protein